MWNFTLLSANISTGRCLSNLEIYVSVSPEVREEAHPENLFSHMIVQSCMDLWRRLFGKFFWW